MSPKNNQNLWAGVDLAASERGISAVAWGRRPPQVQVQEVQTDAELLDFLKKVAEVWIDAPLTAAEGPFRTCDRMLQRCGLSVMPLTWPAMQKLSQRAQNLRTRIPDIPWHETFPWALYRSWGLKRKDLTGIRHKLSLLGFPAEKLSIHACDALAAWWMGWLRRQNRICALAGPDGTLWVPQALVDSPEKSSEVGLS